MGGNERIDFAPMGVYSEQTGDKRNLGETKERKAPLKGKGELSGHATYAKKKNIRKRSTRRREKGKRKK